MRILLNNLEKIKLKISRIKERKRLKSTGEVKEYTRVRGYLELPEFMSEEELVIVQKGFIDLLNNLLERYFPYIEINLDKYPNLKKLLKDLEKEVQDINVTFVEILTGEEDKKISVIVEKYKVDDEIADFIEEMCGWLENITGIEDFSDLRYDWVNRIGVVSDDPDVDVVIYVELYCKRDRIKVEVTSIEPTI